MTDQNHAPPRLVQTSGPAGDCVREALAQREPRVLPPRFALVQERRLRRTQRQLSLLGLALVASLLGFRALHQQEPLPDIRAELAENRASGNQRLTAVSAGPVEPPRAPAPSAAPGPKPENALAPPLKTSAPRTSRSLLARVTEPSPPLDAVAAPASEAVAAGGGATACAQLARGGASEAALGCYARLASGTGMSAELALFEQARLEGKALRRPDRALSTLDDYRRRFPNGSLRAEVMLAQIDWLLASGNSSKARQIVDEALASGLLRERTVELQRLQATLSDAPGP